MNYYQAELSDNGKPRPPSPAGREQFARWQTYIYKFLLIGSPGGDSKEIDEALKGKDLDRTDELFRSPDTFIRRRLLLADLYLARNDRAGARLAVEGALAAILSVENPSDRPLQLFMYLIDTMDRLWQLDEHRRLSKFIKILSPVLERELPQFSLWSVRFHLLQYVAALESDNPTAAYAYAQKAERALAGLHASERLTSTLNDRVTSALWSSAVLAGDKKNTYDAIEKLEALEDVAGARQIGKASHAQAYVLTQGAIGRFMFGEKVSDHDLKLLREFVDSSTFDQREWGLDDYIKLAIFFQESLNGADSGSVQRAAAAFVERARSLGRREFFDHRPRSLVEMRTASALFLELLTRTSENEKDSIDLSLTLIDISERTGISIESELTALLSITESDDERFLIKQGFQFISRKNDFETDTLIDLLKRLQSVKSESEGAFLKLNTTTHSIFGDYYIQLSRWREAIRRANPRLDSEALLASGALIRRHLKPDAASIVFHRSPSSKIFVSCVRPDGRGLLRVALVDTNELRMLDRSVALSLTASHAPDAKLDSQFPAPQAVRLYQGLLAPVADCFSDAQSLVLSLPSGILSTPASALLMAMPDSLGDGYDLAQAEWLITRHSVAYVSSPLQLAYPSAISSVGAHSRKFLGVGDPVLAAHDSEVSDNIQSPTRLRGGRSFTSLQELPETSVELKEIEQTLEGGATLLLRREGSERRLRQEDLSNYRYISFATHGVLREEIPGLIEPALILTADGDDPYADGLLSVSEIADLSSNADLVSLTACNSASFDMTEFSIGLPSLASAFLIAGARNVLATKWSINSQAGVDIGTKFYGAIGALPISDAPQALRKSQLEMITSASNKAFSHPRFWAAFIVYGMVAPTRVRNESVGQMKVDQFDLDSNVGELLAISATRQSGEFLGVGIAPYDLQKKNAPRQVTKIRSNRIEGVSQSDQSFFHRTVVQSGTGTFFTLASTYDKQTDSTLLRGVEIDENGNALNEVILPIRPDFYARSQIVRNSKNSMLIVALGDAGLSVLEVTNDFKVSRNSFLALRDFPSVPYLSTLFVENGLLIAVGSPNDQSPENGVETETEILIDNPLKSLQGCPIKASTTFVTLDAASFKLQVLSTQRDVAVSKLLPDRRGRHVVFGWRQQCLGYQEMFFGLTDGVYIRDVFVDYSGLDTRAIDAARRENGNFLVAVQGEQKIDALTKNFTENRNLIEEISQFGETKDRVKTGRSFVSVFELSPSGKLISKRRVSNGDESFVQGIHPQSGGGAVVFGSASGKGAVWRVSDQ